MRRIALVFALVMVCLPASAVAKPWAVAMFDSTSHDFGTVARGAKAVHRFQVKNLYEEDVHILSVRSSCGCTTPQIVKPDLKTFEVGEIVAEFDTKKFLGNRQATLTVLIDRPFRAEVQLNVQGFIRGDVVLQPGEVDFGAVQSGVPAERKVAVSYAGWGDWRIVDAQSANPNFEVELVETARQQGRVSYDLLVRLTKDAPVGYLRDQLMLITNDAQAKQLPVDVTGRVTPSTAITISPAPLLMGKLHPGDKVTKQLIVRGKKPFKIVDVKCDDDSFEVRMTPVAKQVHVIPITFTAKEPLGKVTRQIAIETDQTDSIATFTAIAQVIEDEAGSGTERSKKPEKRVEKREPDSLDLTSPADRPATDEPSAEAPPNEQIDAEGATDEEPMLVTPKSSAAGKSASKPVPAKSAASAKPKLGSWSSPRSSETTDVVNPLRKKLDTKDAKSSPLSSPAPSQPSESAETEGGLSLEGAKTDVAEQTSEVSPDEE